MSTTEAEWVTNPAYLEFLKEVRERKDWICKFQFFDREKGQWSEMISPQVGFNENFVQDETTDDASLNFIWRGSDKPNLSHMMWCRVLHFYRGDEYNATYDSEGLPINHNQYVLGNFEMHQSKDKSYWLVKVSLLEPIERMKYVVGETLAYTNQISKTVTDGNGNTITYVKDAYNHLTALERFLKVTPANCDTYEEGYNPHNNKSWYNRLTILDKEFLRNIPFDNDTLSEPDLYTALFKYDKSTGRTPCMYFDIDPTTDLPRNLERDEYLLKFLRQDGFDKPELKLEELLDGTQNVVYKSNVANFATGVVSNVSNLVTNANIKSPAKGLWAAPELISGERNTTGANTVDSGWGIRLPCPIKKINKISRLKMNLIKSMVRTARKDNLEEFCFEDQQYTALSAQEINDNVELFHYKEGDNILYIKNYYFTDVANDSYRNFSFWFYLEYEPMLDCRIGFGDEEFETIVNQTDSQADTNKYGLFLRRYLNNMNKADLVFSKKHYHPNELYSIGSRVVDEASGKSYLITNVSYQNINLELLAVYQLNENHFRRNLSVKASKSIRANTTIAYNNLKDRRILIKKKIRLTFDDENVLEEIDLENKKRLLSAIIPGYNYDYAKIPQAALLVSKSHLTKENGDIVEFSKNILTPLNTFQSNNSICMNITMLDNAFAGYRKKLRQIGTPLIGQYQPFSLVESQVPELYTDPFGEIAEADVHLCNLPKYDVDKYLMINNDASTGTTFGQTGLINITNEVYETLVDGFTAMASFPVIDNDLANRLKNNTLYLDNHRNFLKDMLEKLNITFQHELICDNDIMTSNDLIHLSQYFNLEQPNIEVFGYDTNKDFNDDFGNKLSEIAFGYSEEGNMGNLEFEIESYNIASIVIFVNSLPAIIVNNVGLHLKENVLNIKF